MHHHAGRARPGPRRRGSAAWSTRSRRSTGSSRPAAARARGPTSASHMIETNDAERTGIASTAAAAAFSARLAPGLRRGVFIGWSRPSVHTTRLASTAGPAARRVGVVLPDAHQLRGRLGRRARCRRRAARPGRVRGPGPARCRPRSRPHRPVLARSRTTSRPRSPAASSSSVPSVEALSTTTIAAERGGSGRAARRAPPASSSRRFQVTTTATTRVGRHWALGHDRAP